ncbi:hydrolase TatD family protein [Entamoeba histolytica HM-1:IMSS-B]|uniref:Hydrolase TatD family protein n=6 Tax=Entamoeba histolytica TaxID=5759 RepID=C4LSD8_ENTH1|nr:hydrolase TatD family protein [Entamoeba histolytica HM-1:IMSS]EMD42905.1 hydrolase TatD family protein [Entamoeba histolytica KU27]EMH73230.1 hydrolase TatD family protein [Entamoeba histolytica HM-1:IMSS-B]EMS17097.1 hydrolase TatD family protein [Entamoeba histolytica HM-3:IMSS]ENY61291.1 hydrolase TatD family protein, putative [Entamoeba histolytica HM-1:IMSS-A]GAT91604.1 hydrolase tatd family protein [Entamoeba histolytica]|eukprot:XP_656369.1 hydrolase TatD family protein [Entamoeba histolytica HM-1:IMSS]
MIDCHCHLPSSYKCILNLNENDTSDSFYRQLISFGIHPWHCGDETLCQKQLQVLEQLVKQNQIIAIGECGLDNKLTTNSISTQKKWFLKQIELNQRYNLPVYIHCVNMVNEIILLKKKWINQRWIYHGFNSSNEVAKKLISMNCWLSFGRNVLNNNNIKINNSLKIAFENKRLLIETDNDETHFVDLQHIYNSIANRLNCSIDILINEVHDSLHQLQIL